MKRICLVLIMICWVLLSINAQSSSVRVCTEEEIPASKRKRFLKVAENFLENYYNNLFLNINDDIVQESFINNYMVNGTQRYKPEFTLNIPGQSQYLMPEQYLQELSNQFKTENFEEWMLEVKDITFDKDFKATNNLDCFVTAHYTLTLNNGENKLYSRSCTALCYWSQSRMYDQVRLMQVEPVKDIITNQPETKDYSLYKNISHQELQRKANQGDTKAQFTLGWNYYKGIGTTIDDFKAIGWLTKAADKGHVAAQTFLGFYFYEKENYTTAFKWFEKASILGWDQAQCQLANMYFYGKGTDKNLSKAVEWLTKAAIQEYEEAQYRLGLIYLNGYSGEKNIEKAKEWLSKAAQQGNVDAYSSLEKLKNIMK